MTRRMTLDELLAEELLRRIRERYPDVEIIPESERNRPPHLATRDGEIVHLPLTKKGELPHA
jgi:hypothetical protein